MRGEHAHGERHAECEKRAQGRDMKRLHQSRMHAVRVIGKVHRPHAREEVGDLLRRVGEEFRDHLDRLNRSHDRGDDPEIHREACDALRRRESPPEPFMRRFSHLRDAVRRARRGFPSDRGAGPEARAPR